MEIKLIGHDSLYQVEQLAQSLFGVDALGAAVSQVRCQGDQLYFDTTVTVGEKTTCGSRQLPAAEQTRQKFHRCLRQSFFDAALPHLPEYPPWGALSGVRPTKLSTRHLLQGGNRSSADRLLEEEYYVTPQRRKMALDCSEASARAVAMTQTQDISMYIGIPFCPTRCSYCSFVSRTAGKKKDMLEAYLQKLLLEVSHTGKLLQQSGKTVRTVYIGGGTPTTFSAEQLERLMAAVNDHIDLSRCIEYTVEAGRPDTLSPEKLAVIKAGGAHRISINPQTMVDSVLSACGRPHSAEDVRRVYGQALSAGLRDINMDLIAGLPTDTLEGFCRSLDELIALQPANITVHTLALKKGADLFEQRKALPTRQEVAQMLQYAGQELEKAGYAPYYLYRQKYMSGSFENIGYSRAGRDCLYNIYMMEELHSIVSLGGGGMSKVNLSENKLERFHNPKFPEQYIDQFEKVLEQKTEMFRLLQSCE